MRKNWIEKYFSLKQQPPLGPCFMNTLPNHFNNFCLITDFMCYIHMPPPNNISKYFNYLWDACITGNNNITSVIFVFDKPEYLPPPRELVHDKGAKHSPWTRNSWQHAGTSKQGPTSPPCWLCLVALIVPCWMAKLVNQWRKWLMWFGYSPVHILLRVYQLCNEEVCFWIQV